MLRWGLQGSITDVLSRLKQHTRTSSEPDKQGHGYIVAHKSTGNAHARKIDEYSIAMWLRSFAVRLRCSLSPPKDWERRRETLRYQAARHVLARPLHVGAIAQGVRKLRWINCAGQQRKQPAIFALVPGNRTQALPRHPYSLPSSKHLWHLRSVTRCDGSRSTATDAENAGLRTLDARLMRWVNHGFVLRWRLRLIWFDIHIESNMQMISVFLDPSMSFQQWILPKASRYPRVQHAFIVVLPLHYWGVDVP